MDLKKFEWILYTQLAETEENCITTVHSVVYKFSITALRLSQSVSRSFARSYCVPALLWTEECVDAI